MYTCEKNGKTFSVKGKKVAEVYKAAGYIVTEEATVKKATKAKAKTDDTADTGE